MEITKLECPNCWSERIRLLGHEKFRLEINVQFICESCVTTFSKRYWYEDERHIKRMLNDLYKQTYPYKREIIINERQKKLDVKKQAQAEIQHYIKFIMEYLEKQPNRVAYKSRILDRCSYRIKQTGKKPFNIALSFLREKKHIRTKTVIKGVKVLLISK